MLLDFQWDIDYDSWRGCPLNPCTSPLHLLKKKKESIACFHEKRQERREFPDNRERRTHQYGNNAGLSSLRCKRLRDTCVDSRADNMAIRDGWVEVREETRRVTASQSSTPHGFSTLLFINSWSLLRNWKRLTRSQCLIAINDWSKNINFKNL